MDIQSVACYNPAQMRRTIILLLILFYAGVAQAAYISSPESLVPAAGSLEGSTVTSLANFGLNLSGIASGSTYSIEQGFLVAALGEVEEFTTVSQETDGPLISAIMFDGQLIGSYETVNPDVTLTALIIDVTGIDEDASSIEVNSVITVFSALTGESSYIAQTGLLTYKPSVSLGSGRHSVNVTAFDTLGNSSNYQTTFLVTTESPTVVAGQPLILRLSFDGRSIVSGDYVPADAVITAAITSETSIDIQASSIEVNSSVLQFSALTGNSTYDAATGNLVYDPETNFPAGINTLTIRVINQVGTASARSINFKVAGDTSLVGPVLNNPNPFNPNNESTEIAYYLTTDSNVTVYIFNALGQLVYRQDYVSGATGGQAGYNEISWTGKSFAGYVLGNDIYFLRLVAGGKVIGRGKIAILK